ncbi:MAG: hypothetical protein E7612_05635 [Ruminococcaceae bacterium]|nr:hypothetical protein [Oscillospiraceae bacterium]
MKKLLIGWAEETLVPEKKVSLAGQFYERISQFVESEITATAMAVESNGEQMVLVSADIVGVPSFLLNLIRENVSKKSKEIDPMKIIVAATHTHTSHVLGDPTPEGKNPILNTREILKEFMKGDQEYKPLVTADESVMKPAESTVFVAEQIAKAVVRAWENRAEALYANEFGRAAVGMCRRVAYDDGTAEMWGDTNTANFVALEGGNDSGIELIYTFDKNKKLTGVVANIACPSQILEQRSFISADYWGRAKANIREKLGRDVYLLGLGGAGGDQCPRDLVRWVEPETPIDDPHVKRPNPIRRKADPSMFDISGCNRAGKRISNEIISVFEEICEYKDEAILEHRVRNMNLPLRKATKSEYNNAVREIEYYVEKNSDRGTFTFEDNAKVYVHAGLISRYRYQQFAEMFTIESHIVRFGDVAFATNPFELFLDFGNRLKARSYAAQTFVVQLCCGKGGYLPTEKAEKAGHYSAYITSGNVGHEGGDLMIREQLKEINEMFEGEKIYVNR